MLLFYLLLILINIIPIAYTLDSCRQTFGSNKYDLNKLSHLTFFDNKNGYRYALTPCGLVPTDKCGKATSFESGMTGCQERVATSIFTSSLGFLDGYGKPPNLEFKENPQGAGTGVVMTMRNAKCTGGDTEGIRIVTVTFICDKSVHNPTSMDVVERPSCIFSITIKAAEACPNGADTVGGGVIAGGTVFIIILLVLVTVYLVGGVLYNRFKNQQTGLALLPHPSFWLLLVGLFNTGCRFSLNFIRTCGGGTSASGSVYQSV